uniref:Uncharacterized protein n=1 Tax=Ralstonia solanacearum TaxID=305 RepID=A0A0S4WEY7_RALSL|nr:protein of unknown function [Ralstonia solanacearum]
MAIFEVPQPALPFEGRYDIQPPLSQTSVGQVH